MKLLLTLGHNSSAILIRNNIVLCGYEEERLSKVKADSSYPILAITEILKYYPEARELVDKIFISHWFWDYKLVENKYYRPKHLETNFKNARITTLSKKFTHHDAHAKSVWNFCGDDTGLTIVADGFGNKGECLSLYTDGKLFHRSYNIKYSLGLMYQYATSYLDMKEFQDEYKLLGYEQQITENTKEFVKTLIDIYADEVYSGLMEELSSPHTNLEVTLKQTREYWYSVFRKVASKTNKSAIAYFVQGILEKVIYSIINLYGIKDIKVSGGVFYNVKLNNMILRYADTFEANPLAGDQGAALGFTDVRYTDLFWGKREIYDKLLPYKIISPVEVFKGNMEFGPRALGNTSTLAAPTMENVKRINALNGRDTVMPMAPIVTKEKAEELFADLHKVKKSKYFMIIAFDFLKMNEKLRGAAHYDQDRDVYTGRIQLIDKYSSDLYKVINNSGGILINTSLNAHGQPIIYDNEDYKIMGRIQDDAQS